MYRHLATLEFPTPFSARLHSQNILRFLTAGALCIRLAITIGLCVLWEYNLGAYTLWSFTMGTIFVGALLLALFVEHWAFSLTIMFLLPIVLNNAFFVPAFILILIQDNPDLFTRGSTCDPTPPSNPLNAGLLRNGDWVEHAYPYAELFVLLILLGTFARNTIVRTLNKWPSIDRLFYFVYWMCSCACLIMLYDLIFDAGKVYPSSYNWGERFGIGLGLIVPWMLIMWLIFVSRQSHNEIEAYHLPAMIDM